jgi:NADPH2:quinone reductase
MKAAYITKPGPPENITFGSLPKPKPLGSQVLVKVKAVAVNPVDTYIRSGLYQMDLPKPFVIGCDLAGVVEAVGPDARKYKPGDRVWGSNQGLLGRQGTFSEFAAVDECWLYPTPDEVSHSDAAAMALVGITAHLGCFRIANLKMGEKVFVRGGTGGVGSTVVQMARAIGANVLAAVGSDNKVQLCRQIGANVAVNYKTADLDAVFAKFGPIDLWWETTREQDFDLAVRHMAMHGRIIVIAGRDSRPTLPVGPFYVKDCSLHGFAMFNAPPEEQRKCAAEINRWMARGRLKPIIGKTLPLSKAAEAHRLQEENTIRHTGTLTGKIVLTL